MNHVFHGQVSSSVYSSQRLFPDDARLVKSQFRLVHAETATSALGLNKDLLSISAILTGIRQAIADVTEHSKLCSLLAGISVSCSI